jgi:hypothetical protein
MIGKMPSDQGRARGLYDEQLQRKLQEKLAHDYARGAPGALRPALFAREAIGRLAERI